MSKHISFGPLGTAQYFFLPAMRFELFIPDIKNLCQSFQYVLLLCVFHYTCHIQFYYRHFGNNNDRSFWNHCKSILWSVCSNYLLYLLHQEFFEGMHCFSLWITKVQDKSQYKWRGIFDRTVFDVFLSGFTGFSDTYWLTRNKKKLGPH